MSHEARINEALKQLGEEFRLGMVAVDEYRRRRRMLLESWGERDATTSPGARFRTLTGHKPPARPASTPPARRGLLIGVAAALLALAGAGYFLLAPSGTATVPGPPAAAPAPERPQVAAVKTAADEFLARNVWDADSISAFLDQWRLLAPEDRPRALAEPSVRTLRYQLDQNIEAESLLVADDAAPEARARLEMLQDFARQLGD